MGSFGKNRFACTCPVPDSTHGERRHGYEVPTTPKIGTNLDMPFGPKGMDLIVVIRGDCPGCWRTQAVPRCEKALPISQFLVPVTRVPADRRVVSARRLGSAETVGPEGGNPRRAHPRVSGAEVGSWAEGRVRGGMARKTVADRASALEAKVLRWTSSFLMVLQKLSMAVLS